MPRCPQCDGYGTRINTTVVSIIHDMTKNIAISEETYIRLRDRKRGHDTFDDVIKYVIDRCEADEIDSEIGVRR